MLKWRLVSAAVIITGLLGLLQLDYYHARGIPGIWLLPLAVAATLLMAGELLAMWQGRSDRPAAWSALAGPAVVVLATAAPLLLAAAGWLHWGEAGRSPLGWTLLGVVCGVGCAFVGEMARYTAPGRSAGAVALAILAVAYVGLLPAFLVLLRLYGDSATGMSALLSLIIVVKMSDTGAYFTGRLLGRHKLAPVLSPGKTIEGVAGGLLAAMLAAVVCFGWLLPATLLAGRNCGSWWGWLLFAVAVTVAGITGDLAESLIKRDSNCKDSSRWLPGLGGVLDIMDSLLFAAPVAYGFWVLGLVGPA